MNAPIPPPSRERPLRIVCFGDSITGCRPDQPYHHQYLKWGDLLELMLEARFGIGTVHVINAGLAGGRLRSVDDLPGAFDRLQRDVLDHHPDLVLMLLGANDLAPPAGSDGPAGVAADLESLGRKILAAGAQLCLLQYPLPRAALFETAWSHHALANAPIAEAGHHLGVPVIALEPAFAAAEQDGVPREALADPIDGVHLRPEGERAVAHAVFEKLYP